MLFDDVAGVPATAGSPDAPARLVLAPVRYRRRWLRRSALALVAGLLVTFAWIAATTPLSRSLHPPVEPGLTLLSAEGRPIARRGAIVDRPVDVAALPRHVWLPVLAIEDRRFFEHHGLDPRGLARAAWRNARAGAVREGGSTISQQLAKQAFLSADRSLARKLREGLIAVWLELRLDKEEILSRYLSAAYYGDNVYGLRAAARHYFGREPEELRLGQAAMLAGLLKAPSRLNPNADLAASQARTRTVLGAMADAGLLEPAAAAAIPAPRPVRRSDESLPSGSWFADWVFPDARRAAAAGASTDRAAGRQEIRTTLEEALQRLAARTVARHRLAGAQVALVALRPDGRVAAMIGGRAYRDSAFNRATQARRPPGSTFKLFVYLAALRAGYTPDSRIEDAPVTVAGWSPANASGAYLGPVNLRTAFGESSNVAAVRLSQRVGMEEVVGAARDLGVASPLDPAPSLALGTSGVSLLELTAAYAAALSGRYPVRPTGLAVAVTDRDVGAEEAVGAAGRLDRGSTWPQLLDLLWASANLGTGRAAALDVPTFGKTGTSQDNRDAWFVGFAGDLVVGVWVGRDDNAPLRGLSGGGLPAAIWRDFMTGALRAGAVRTGVDSPFEVPRFRYVPAAAPDPRPLVRQAPARDWRNRRGAARRWRRWWRDEGPRDRRWGRD